MLTPRLGWVLTFLLLAGCVGSIFDPAPYQPEVDKAVLDSHAPAYDPVTILQFNDLSDAAYKLEAIASGYANARNTIMRQELLIDVPAIGLGVATVANGVFHGAQTATIALGLGSATISGTRLYFSPQNRVTAYNNAASALACASSVSTVMNAENVADGDTATSISQNLAALLVLADNQIISGKLSKQNSISLLAARDTAQGDLNTLNSALSTISTAPAQLQSFAVTVIRGATTKVVTGSQDLDAVLTIIKGASSSVAPTKVGAAPAGAPAPVAGPAPTAAQIESQLQVLSAEAISISQRISSAWSNLTACSNTS